MKYPGEPYHSRMYRGGGLASKSDHSSKVYTGGGDRGRTSLFSGERVMKSDLRVDAYGALDELNSIVGAVEAFLPPSADRVRKEIQTIQSLLFEIGAWLASTPGATITESLKPFREVSVKMLEAAIDRMDAELVPLTHFILPGGHRAAAMSHVARSVCRRAERKMVHLLNEKDGNTAGKVYATMMIFLNRLSDYFFVLARFVNHMEGIEEISW